MDNESAKPGYDDDMAKKDQEDMRLEEVKSNLSDEEIVLGVLSLAWGEKLPGSVGYKSDEHVKAMEIERKKELPMSFELLAKTVQSSRPELDQKKIQEIINSSLAKGKVIKTPEGKFIATFEYATEITSDNDKNRIYSGILADALMDGIL